MDNAQIRNHTASLNIRFEDGSISYGRFDMTPAEFVEELNRWKDRYLLKVDDVNAKTGIIYLTAKEKGE